MQSPRGANNRHNALVQFGKALTRTKKLQAVDDDLLVTQLRRCLSTFDITLIGISSTLGSGVYILTGDVSQKIAGPAIVISITIAAIASVLCGLCYTEFAARVPKAGSAYVYSYVVIGEFFAFIVGWNLILEYGIGAAAVVKGFSTYLDSALDHRITNATEKLMGKWYLFGSEAHLDFVALLVCILVTVSIAYGVKNSSYLNSICTTVTTIVVVMFIAMGLFYVDVDNFTRNFAPFGVKGILSGASSCFYAFIGFDAVCMVSEEARNPNKSVPISVIITIGSCYIGFTAAAIVLNMMIPYTDMHGSAAFSDAFSVVGLPFGKYCIGIGAMFGLLGNSIASMMMMPRFLYSMAQDGLLFSIFGKVYGPTAIPLYSTIAAGLLTGVMAFVLDLHALVEMVSIGTILAYTLVTLSILILRYQPVSVGMVRKNSSRLGSLQDMPIEKPATPLDEDPQRPLMLETRAENDEDDDAMLIVQPEDRSPSSMVISMLRCRSRGREPTEATEFIVVICTVLLVAELFATASILHFASAQLFDLDLFVLIPLIVLVLSALITTTAIASMPQNSQRLYFKVPLVPWIPSLAVFFNIYLMFGLSKLTWIRFGVWLTVGLLLYFCYGFRHSKQRIDCDKSSVLVNSEPPTVVPDADEGKSPDDDPLIVA